MKVVLPSNNWFDVNTARTWPEAVAWNGAEHVSCATGKLRFHERLYCTANGNWIIKKWEGPEQLLYSTASPISWTECSPEAATAWLINNARQVPEDLVDVERELEV